MISGRVTELWRYPVKSMLGERLEEAEITEHGVLGDRSFALVDVETGKVCSAKRHDLWGALFTFRARLERPGLATITFPDGTQRSTDDADIHDALTEVVGRPVRLAATAPTPARIEEVWDESKGSQMYGEVVGQSNGNPVIDFPASLAAPGDFFDAAAIHLLTTNSLSAFGRAEPGSTFDVRRFRPNLVVEAEGDDGFVENDWKRVDIGEVDLRTLMPVPRCVMTTLAQDDLSRDPEILRAAARHNMVDTKVLGEMPCAGIYATVANGGTIRDGQAITART